jgi:hypothetical protein
LALHVTHPESNSKSASIPAYQTQDKGTPNSANLPLRLLDCLGLTIPVFFFVPVVDAFEGGGLRLGAGGGSGAGLMTGEVRKAVGDGIVIVSIVITWCTDTWTDPALNVSPEKPPVAGRKY